MPDSLQKTRADWNQATWLVTGASGGFGLEIVKAVLGAGGRVAAATRRPELLEVLRSEHPESLLPIALDPGYCRSIQSAVDLALGAYGPIDVLVNNAGYTLVGAVEEIREAEYRALMDVNFFGAVALTQQLLPAMRANKRGFIVNFSSVSGVVGAPGSGFYAAAKFALEGWSDSLRAEVGPLGIDVMLVEPGPFRTPFFSDRQAVSARAIQEYANVRERETRQTEQPGKQPGDPARGAAAILQAMQDDRPPARLVLGALAIDIIARTYRAKLDEVRAWEHLSRTADFPRHEGAA